MKRHFLSWSVTALLACSSLLHGHCQMPCGIYHDDMVFDQIDQYVETMYKGITVMSESKFTSLKDKNEFVRWVVQKENASNEAANLLVTYFLMQKVKPGEDDTIKRLTSAHKLLFLIVQIKQNADVEFVEAFNEEWEKFKLMFHREGYECDMEKLKLKKFDEEKKAANAKDKAPESKNKTADAKNKALSHDHDHDHEEAHAKGLPHTH